MMVDIEIILECKEHEVERLLKVLGYYAIRREVRRVLMPLRPLTVHIFAGSSLENMEPLEKVVDLSLYRSGVAIDVRPTLQSNDFSPRLSKIVDIKRFSIKGFRQEVRSCFTRFQFDVPQSRRQLSISIDNAKKFLKHESFDLMNIMIGRSFSFDEPLQDVPTLITTYINGGGTNTGHGIEIKKYVQKALAKNNKKVYLFQVGRIMDTKDENNRKEVLSRIEYLKKEVFDIGGALMMAVDSHNHTVITQGGEVRKIAVENLDYTELNYGIPNVISLISSVVNHSWFTNEYTRFPDHLEIVNLVESDVQMVVSRPVRGLNENMYWYANLQDLFQGQSEIMLIVIGFTNIGSTQYQHYISNIKNAVGKVIGAQVYVENYVLGTSTNWLMFCLKLPRNISIIDLYKKYNSL